MRTHLIFLMALYSASAAKIAVNNDPPPVEQAARMARYIVHNTDWCVLSHITHQRNATGYPMGRVFSMSDGPVGESTGTPYIYTSFFDGFARDLKIDDKCAMSVSLAQGNYCSTQGYDPENPRCAQVMIIGHFVFINNGTKEWDFAKESLFSRHPEMKSWPESHSFKFGKLAISNVQIVDNFGGSKYPTVPEYYNATPTGTGKWKPSEYNRYLNNVYSVNNI